MESTTIILVAKDIQLKQYIFSSNYPSMTLYTINPLEKRNKLLRWLLHGQKFNGLSFVFSPLYIIFMIVYLIYEHLLPTRRIRQATFDENGVSFHYNWQKNFHPYQEIELVSGHYCTKGYSEKNNYQALSSLEFHFIEDSKVLHHDYSIGRHEKALKELIAKRVRIEASRNGQPSRFGRAFKK